MKIYLHFAVAALVFIACSSTSKNRKEYLYIPVDMPDICQGVDFSVNKGMREECGVKPVRVQGYYNLPMQRYLINPSQASLVKTGDKIEIRFPNTFPVPLDSEQVQGIKFSDSKRLSKIQNKMDYKEFYNEKKERYKLFKLTIPSDTEPVVENTLCFKVPELKGDERTRSVAMGERMDMLPCDSLDILVKIYVK